MLRARRAGRQGSTTDAMPLESRIATRVAGLDDRLGGGIPRGHIVLVSGPPGSLKSPFAYRIRYLEARERGAAGLCLSMEQSRASLVAQMASLGMSPEQAKGVHIIDVRSQRREIEDLRVQPRGLRGLRRQLGRY